MIKHHMKLIQPCFCLVALVAHETSATSDIGNRSVDSKLPPAVEQLVEEFEEKGQFTVLLSAINKTVTTPSESFSNVVSNELSLLNRIACFYNEEFDWKEPQRIYLHPPPPRGYRSGTPPAAVSNSAERTAYEERIRINHAIANSNSVQRILRSFLHEIAVDADPMAEKNVESVSRLVSKRNCPAAVVLNLLVNAANRQNLACDLAHDSVFCQLQGTLIRNLANRLLETSSTNGIPARIRPDCQTRLRSIAFSQSPRTRIKEAIEDLSLQSNESSLAERINAFEENFLFNEIGQLLLLDGKNVQLLESQASLLGAINREVRSAGSQTSPSDLDADSVSRLRNVQYGMSKIWKESFDRYVRWGLLDADEQRRLQKLAAGEPPEADNGDETER